MLFEEDCVAEALIAGGFSVVCTLIAVLVPLWCTSGNTRTRRTLRCICIRWCPPLCNCFLESEDEEEEDNVERLEQTVELAERDAEIQRLKNQVNTLSNTVRTLKREAVNSPRRSFSGEPNSERRNLLECLVRMQERYKNDVDAQCALTLAKSVMDAQ